CAKRQGEGFTAAIQMLTFRFDVW
nr:immunoglobulin heavy chain junction region [Macaca mulatta]MOW47836.1 immunoglobulin heavy chain junction region [Macaca mulatta]MOW48423.1 immunoglobulin heavy chain junction region [Macaca mulatta]MOW48657.1 immunoglobulin heavy chain junction region [Macaca mulatta]MOW50096.1 immunoglobulin heavy chain junction region [Macaca mulatta]